MNEIDHRIDRAEATEADKEERIRLLQELNDIDHFESMDLHQKARLKWNVEGDENSKIFHGIIKQRRCQAIQGVMSKVIVAFIMGQGSFHIYLGNFSLIGHFRAWNADEPKMQLLQTFQFRSRLGKLTALLMFFRFLYIRNEPSFFSTNNTGAPTENIESKAWKHIRDFIGANKYESMPWDSFKGTDGISIPIGNANERINETPNYKRINKRTTKEKEHISNNDTY
nr:RNA-directed DNA polymerase, eukaryota, reverse transcriptase zinc-binding domain protein [Tanacetum cinerariifolium]